MSSCTQALASIIGQAGAKGWLGRIVDLDPKARVSPQALSEGCGMLRLGQVSLLEGAHERTQWV
jgi:hypothetical protein